MPDIESEQYVHIAPSWRFFEEEPLYPARNTIPPVQYEQPIFTSNPWARNPRDPADAYLSSTNVASDFLPIQYPPGQRDTSMDEPDHPISRSNSKELVGLGLYDPPDVTSSLLTSGFHSSGKGLKLEETWQPPENDESDDEQEADGEAEADASEADQDSSEEEEEELEDEPPAAQKPQQGQWFAQQPRYLPNMSGQSFFFDDDEAVAHDWWYNRPKQPTAQDAGIGCGWL